MCVTARVVDATVGLARLRRSATGSPSVRSIAFGGSVGDWCQVRNARPVRVGERQEGLERGLVAAEEALGLARSRGRGDRGTADRPRATRPGRAGRSRRRPGARPTAPFGSAAIDRLARDPCSARRSTGPRATRGLRRRIVDVDDERAPPVAVLVVLAEQGERRAARSSRSPAKRCSVRAISTAAAVNGALCIMTLSRAGTFDVPVAAVERLGPDERRRLGRAPLEVARPGRHAVRSARDPRAAASRACGVLRRRDPRPRRRARSGRTS